MSAAGQANVFQSTASTQLLSHDLQRFIVENVWPNCATNLADFSGFFMFLASRIQRDILWSCPEHMLQNVFAATTYTELIGVFSDLRSGVTQPKRDVVAALKQRYPAKSTHQCVHLLEFAAGIWATLPLNISSRNVRLRDDNVIVWADDTSLQALTRNVIPRYTAPNGVVQSLESVLLDQELTAARLHQVCRIRIEWTDNLASHLDYDAKSDKVLIYPHKALLVAHLENLDATPQVPFAIDREVLLETICTLDLLLPPTAGTRSFLAARSLLYNYVRCEKATEAIDLTEFIYWRGRLARLQALFNRPPTTLMAMWYDRRRPLQWMTFWLAGLITILTVVFGIIGSYAALKQIELAQLSYDLSLAQACLSSAVPERFCGS